MKPREILELAVELNRKSDAAKQRAAVGRAYYAAYHEAAQFLNDLGESVDKGPGGHGDVRYKLANSGDTLLARVAFNLGDLHSKRILADYRLDRAEPEHRDYVADIIDDAGDLFNALHTCRSEPRKSRIQKAIKEWRQ